jgi:hypothetical protein
MTFFPLIDLKYLIAFTGKLFSLWNVSQLCPPIFSQNKFFTVSLLCRIQRK